MAAQLTGPQALLTQLCQVCLISDTRGIGPALAIPRKNDCLKQLAAQPYHEPDLPLLPVAVARLVSPPCASKTILNQTANCCNSGNRFAALTLPHSQGLMQLCLLQGCHA